MILFRTIRWKNFLSTGAHFTEVKLDKSPTTLIIGENGAGKSTILDAICFALFNKPFRSVNKPQLLNSINQSKCVVEVEFSIGNKQYKIVRGIKPTVFEIYLNDELLNQDAASKDYQKYLEEHVLKLNYKSFTQIVILGSASFTPFMQLSAAMRRDIIEDLLDIKVFSVMNDVLKLKLADIRSEIGTIDSDAEILKTKVRLQQEYIVKLEQDKKKKSDDIDVILESANANVTSHVTIIDIKKKEILFMKNLIADHNETTAKHKKLLGLKDKILDKKQKLEDEIQFYHINDTCPTCNQALEENFKAGKIQTHDEKLKDINTGIEDIQKQIKDVEERLELINKTKETIAEINEEIVEVSTKLIAEQNYVAKLTVEKENSNVGDTSIPEEKAKLKQLAKDVVELSNVRIEKVDEKGYHELASLLLKDTGIKTKIIKQYLPVMNKIINKYLQSMDFFVHFELDEAFSETIKSRHRDEFTYASFSEGEKQRIDLALLFAWRTIAKMKNSANTNLLMLDEVFDSSLDSGGADLLYQILGTLDSDINTFVISHRDLMFDKFRSVIKFQKINNFSEIVK
jgi:DNA repair exonuclease SbcCD ATPase subunit